MIHDLIYITSVISVFSGVFVMLSGDWAKLALKHAVVSISTLSSIFVLILVMNKSPVDNCMATGSLCDVYNFYQVAQSISFVLFHIAVGRDAIHFRRGDRRTT